MQGYVQNKGNQAYFICQRQIPPGGKVSLEAIYRSVGVKSGLENSIEFVEWIRTNVFRRGSWGYYDDEGVSLLKVPKKIISKKKTSRKSSSKKVSSKHKTSSKKEEVAGGAGLPMRRDPNSPSEGITPNVIIEAPYEQARALIEKTKDRTVLKRALKLTNHFNGKEQHMRHIIKRLAQVY